jgi:hypothetical protein
MDGRTKLVRNKYSYLKVTVRNKVFDTGPIIAFWFELFLWSDDGKSQGR